MKPDSRCPKQGPNVWGSTDQWPQIFPAGDVCIGGRAELVVARHGLVFRAPRPKIIPSLFLPQFYNLL